MVKGGRFRLPQILVKPISLIQKMGIRLLIGLKNGKVKFFGISMGKDIAKILAEEIDRQRNDKAIKIAIAHADNLRAAEELKLELEKKSGMEVLFISSVSPVTGTHAGPGALIAAFCPVELDS
jgi:fatty acid-binding protein DegV